MVPKPLFYLAYVATVGVACAVFVHRDRNRLDESGERRWMALVLLTGLLGLYFYLTREF